ncbi:MAG: choice-of-anchor J domain-containing protein, partial [Muribaculaceae bacterium]|nr:choice-of-anchor J domain-containing protein [Muribaculaceae bacterium]
IAPLDGNWNAIACDAAGQLYGISYTGETVDDDFVVSASLLNKIDKASGAVTAVGTTGQLPKYLSSATIDPVSGRMFWTVSDAEGSGRLCEVNLSTGLATVLAEFTENDEVQGMYVPYGENAADTPARTNATLRYEGGKMKLSWTPVTATIYGTPLDGAVTYTVTRYPGAVKVATKTAATSFEEAVSGGASLEQYYYTVVTHVGDATSGEAKSNVITLGSVTPPYMNDFSSAEALEGYTLIDANKDNKTWIIADGRARMDYNSSIAMDDWLVTPPVALEAGKLYLVSFKASGNGTTFTERIEVKYGTEATPAGLSNTLIPVTELRSAQDQEFSQYLVPETDGNYYIGFHGCSAADQYYLFVDDISIAAGLESTAPGLATDIRIVPDPDGAYKATVSFKAPATDLAGAALSSIEKIVVARDGNTVHTFQSPDPGADLDFVE